MSTVTHVIPRTIRPVMRPVNHVPRTRVSAPVPAAPSRLRRVVRTVFTVVVASMLAVVALSGMSHLGQAVESFTSRSVGVIRSQHVPSSERPQVVQVSADPTHAVRSAG